MTYTIKVYDEVSKKWYENEKFDEKHIKKLAMTCYDYGMQGVEIYIKESKKDEV